MKHHLHIIFSGLLTIFLLSACESLPANEQEEPGVVTASEPVEARVEERQPATVQEALQADAQLARTMSLDDFAKHMKSRETYYSQFEAVSYEDDFVKIEMDGDKLKVETPKGKVSLEDDNGKITAEKEKP
ncbi:hypothetical protein [Pontibacter beigongshangensis]|uniref:hypothetical protein n=1 Tax=Pontibacter beigongshangensis TaxID=2574733 RepID=UPI00164FEDAC|nr:hypothetical protein [Pontibacter beigongshangensis]